MASETKEQTEEPITPPRNVHMVTSPKDPHRVQPGSQGSVLTSQIPPHTKVVVDLSPEAENLLKRLMDQTGDSPSDLFRKALSLYKVASESHRDGLAVRAAKSPDSLEAEFIGF